jgi:hypothetical protein
VRLGNIENRLSIWAGAIGLLPPGSAGIERRFEDDDEGTEVLLSMLGRLQNGTDRLLSTVKPRQEIPREGEDMGEQANSGCTMTMGQPDQIQSLEAETLADETFNQGVALSHIEETVNML